MLLESSSLTSTESVRDTAPTPVDGTSSRRTLAARKSSYARVRDEVEAGARKSSADKPAAAQTAKKVSLWQNEDFGFGDLIDIINPLQHLPIVSTFYRNLTGDQLGMAPRVIGGALWGRIGGFVAGIVNSVVEWFTGKDIGDHIYSAIWAKTNGSAVAQTPPPRSTAPAASDAKRETVPVSGADRAEHERHSSLAPDYLVSTRIGRSFYRHEDERGHSGAKPSTVDVSA